jgi:hypothetical protein
VVASGGEAVASDGEAALALRREVLAGAGLPLGREDGE